MNSRTITTAVPHGYAIGKRVYITLVEPDTRWWRRAWFALKQSVPLMPMRHTPRDRPTRAVTYSATAMTENTLHLEPVKIR